LLPCKSAIQVFPVERHFSNSQVAPWRNSIAGFASLMLLSR
jgi:hypothetical protein